MCGDSLKHIQALLCHGDIVASPKATVILITMSGFLTPVRPYIIYKYHLKNHITLGEEGCRDVHSAG